MFLSRRLKACFSEISALSSDVFHLFRAAVSVFCTINPVFRTAVPCFRTVNPNQFHVPVLSGVTFSALCVFSVSALLCFPVSAAEPEILSPGTPLEMSEEEFAPMFPFVISKVLPENAADDGNVTNVASWDGGSVKPAGTDGFIRVENGQFVNDAGVIHFFGTNLTGDSCFPRCKEDAVLLARSLARYGINIVRLHFIDNQGRLFEKNSPDLRTFSKENLEKLDFLIFQLQQNGIYVNLNLHVSRQFREKDGFPGENERPRYDKGLDNFEPRLIELQKEFAHDYLTHVNPYTKKAYVNDPGVAMIEINNENSVACTWRCGDFATLPTPYRETFQRFWNEWLAKKYDSTEAMRRAWNCRFYPEGPEIFPNGDFRKSREENLLQRGNQNADGNQAAAGNQNATENRSENSPQKSVQIPKTRISDWEFITEKAEWTYALTPENTLKIQVEKDGEQSWAPQFHCINGAVKKDVPYTLTLKIRSAKSSSVYVGVSQMGSPWKNLGLSENLALTEEWKEFRFDFLANADEPRARVGFGGLKAGVELEIASVSLHEGGNIGAAPEEKLEDGSVQLVPYNSPHATREQLCDMSDFILELENRYWQTMYHYVKDTLHAHAPVSGTQLRYGGWYAQAALDYCDIHAYWNHPGWLGRSWDMNNWYVRNTALVNFWAQTSGTTNRLANSRVLGLPFTVSEYDHPYPNFYSAEGLPEACAMGAFQNWSVVYQYTWQHNNDYNHQKTNGFFDMTCNTGQLAHAPACWALFRRGDVTRGPVIFLYAPNFTRSDEAELFHSHTGTYHQDLTSDDPALPFVVNTGLNLTDLHLFETQDSAAAPDSVAAPNSAGAGRNLKVISSWDELPEELGRPEKRWLRSETGELYYNWELEGKGFFTVCTPKTKLFTGFAAGRSFEIGDVTLTPGRTRLDWLTFSMTQADARRTLIAATGFIRNTGMKFEDIGGNRITCRNDWGKEPVECEGIPAEIRIRNAAPGMKCFALNPDGSRNQELTVRYEEDGTALLTLSPDFKTIWYELVKP